MKRQNEYMNRKKQIQQNIVDGRERSVIQRMDI